MSEKPARPKDEEERRKEVKKLKAEVQRGLEVVNVKLAHGMIEGVEKSRKWSSIYSLGERMRLHSKAIGINIDALTEFDLKEYPFIKEEIDRVKNEIMNYESIRIDFKEITGLSNEKLEQLFPQIDSYFETRMQAVRVLNRIGDQELQMLAYSLRMVL